MAGPSALEQLFLELINSARLDPLGDAARYITSYTPLTSSDPSIQGALDVFDVSGPALQEAYRALRAVQPLAWNEQIATAARGHSSAMIAADSQSHLLPGELPLDQRIIAAGYTGWSRLSENIFAFASSALQGHAAFMVDWGGPDGGMQSPPGHRNAIMNGALREVGIGVIEDGSPSTRVGPLVVTQDFGSRFASGSFVLGVAYHDTDRDGFYSLGEGSSGLTVGLGGASAATVASGGYTLETFATGQQHLTFTGGGLAGPVLVTIDLAPQSNVKLDIVDGDTLRTSTSATVAGPITAIVGLGLSGLVLGAAGPGSQTVIGTKGHDTINGGAGADRMFGHGGNDIYVVDHANDFVGEAAGDGIDLVRSSISATLGAQVETLALIGTGNINGIGNGLANRLIGNAGNNVLNGAAGPDTMAGGAGSDVYVVNAPGDRVFEGNVAGIDQVRSLVSFSLAGQAIETLALIGTGNINGVGNGLANRLVGNAGNNVLNGGAGNDTLTGGAGHDSFHFTTPLNAAANVDRITDFSVPQDTIRLENAIFTGLGPGMLAPEAFRIGAAAADADDRIVYNSGTGALSFDADGSGAAAAMRFAALSVGLALTNADFLVF